MHPHDITMDSGGALLLLTVLLLLGIAALVLHVAFEWAGAVATLRAFERPPQRVTDPGSIIRWVLTAMLVAPALFLLVLRPAVTSKHLELLQVTSIFGMFCIIAAWHAHGVPNHSRNVKYLLFFVGSSLATLTSQSLLAPIVVVSSVVWSLTFLVALIALVLLRPNVPVALHEASSVRALRLWRHASWLQGPDLKSGLVWLLLSLTSLSGPYLLLRWCAKGRLQRRPVLYLRSFHYKDAGHVFSQIIAPAVHRNVPVTGLVSVMQSPEAVLDTVPILWRADFAVVADANWQAWVEHNLRSALGVVIDLSIATSAVSWEFEQAKRVLPRECILLVHSGRVWDGASEFATVGYDLAAQDSVERARREVGAWCLSVLAAFDAGLPHAEIEPARRQLPMPLLFMVFLPLAIWTGAMLVHILVQS